MKAFLAMRNVRLLHKLKKLLLLRALLTKDKKTFGALMDAKTMNMNIYEYMEFQLCKS